VEDEKMPLTIKRNLYPIGDKRGSRSVIVPKNWWDTPNLQIKSVTMIVDKAMVLTPEQMGDEETVECVLFLLKQRFGKDAVVEIFRRVFDVEIEAEEG